MKKSNIVKLTLDSIGYIVTFYGLWQIVITLSPFFIPILQYLLTFVLLLAIIYPLIYRLTRPPLLREYNLAPLRKEFLVTNERIKVNIQNTCAKVATMRDYVFIKQPNERELYDLLYVTGEAKPETVNYKSPDSDQVDFERENRNKLIVFWEPKDKILPYKVYSHTFYWTPPAKLDEDVNYYFMVPTYLNGTTILEIQTYRPIYEAMAFRTKKLIKDEELVYRYAIFLKRTGGPEPMISNDRFNVKLELTNPKPGVINYLVWSHDRSIKDGWLELAKRKLSWFQKHRKYFSFEYYRLKKAIRKVENKHTDKIRTELI